MSGGHPEVTAGTGKQTPLGGATLHSRYQRGHQTGLQKVWHEGSPQLQLVTPLCAEGGVVLH